MRHFGGPTAARLADTARVSTEHDISEAFHMVDAKHTGLVDATGKNNSHKIRRNDMKKR